MELVNAFLDLWESSVILLFVQVSAANADIAIMGPAIVLMGLWGVIVH